MRSFKGIVDQGLELIGLRPEPIQAIIDEETKHFYSRPGITNVNRIPDTGKIPLDSPHWLRVENLICCFVDMEGSTQLSAELHQTGKARAYRYFTQTAVKIFDEFEAAYIDVRGDGVFALFESDEPHRALAATVSFKTFVAKEFTPNLEKLTQLRIGGHYGIDRETVLVRKLGMRAINRSDRQNEVWAGKPINMAAKLGSKSTDGQIWTSDRFHRCLWGERALRTCGCVGGRYTGETSLLWNQVSVADDERFDFDSAWVLNSAWCERHGNEYCRSILKYDEMKEVRRQAS